MLGCIWLLGYPTARPSLLIQISDISAYLPVKSMLACTLHSFIRMPQFAVCSLKKRRQELHLTRNAFYKYLTWLGWWSRRCWAPGGRRSTRNRPPCRSTMRTGWVGIKEVFYTERYIINNAWLIFLLIDWLQELGLAVGVQHDDSVVRKAYFRKTFTSILFTKLLSVWRKK